jgi:hypothetical protein
MGACAALGLYDESAGQLASHTKGYRLRVAGACATLWLYDKSGVRSTFTPQSCCTSTLDYKRIARCERNFHQAQAATRDHHQDTHRLSFYNLHTMRLKRELKALGIVIPDEPALPSVPITRVLYEDVQNNASHEEVVTDTEVVEAQPPPKEEPPRPVTSATHTVHEVGTILPSNSLPTKTRECSVCSNIHPTEDFPHLEGCAQAPSVCPDCVTEWLSNQVGSTVLLRDVKCPCHDQGCKVSFGHEDVQKYATTDVFDR